MADGGDPGDQQSHLSGSRRRAELPALYRISVTMPSQRNGLGNQDKSLNAMPISALVPRYAFRHAGVNREPESILVPHFLDVTELQGWHSTVGKGGVPIGVTVCQWDGERCRGWSATGAGFLRPRDVQKTRSRRPMADAPDGAMRNCEKHLASS